MAAASLRVRHHGLGMVGYVLSRAGAEWLLKAALPLEDKAIDQVITDLVRHRMEGWAAERAVLVSHPPLVHQLKRCLGALDAVSWPWIPVLGSLEPPRRNGENAQKTGKNGGKMGEKWPKESGSNDRLTANAE